LGDEALFESGAILWDLAERYPGLMPADPAERLRALQWLMLQVAGVGPMFGQAGWFLRSAPQRVDFAVDRYVSEARRLAGVLDGRLQVAPWLAGSTYTVADIAHFGWIRSASYADVDLADFPALTAWEARIAARPAVQRAVARMAAKR
jgi:GSH-dependent disulfide-bond oxidoreductase